MKGKEKLQCEIVRNNNISADGMEYSYNLIMRKSRRVASYRLPLYSIKVVLTAKDGNKTEAELKDVFSDIGKAIVFYQKVVDNLVTPINLPYILEDEIYI